jgi:hypothetical protein
MGTHPLTALKNLIVLLLYSCVFLLGFSLPASLEASLFNPLLDPTLPGFEAFLEGKAAFEEENWEKAIDCFFKQVIQKGHKPVFNTNYFIDEDGDFPYVWDLDEIDEMIEYFLNSHVYYDFSTEQAASEAYYSLYRHSRFYLGLIFLYQNKIKSAHYNFLKAILFPGAVEKAYPIYFRSSKFSRATR